MPERQICCPRCGQPRIDNTGVFCGYCGAQLINVGGRPGALDQRPVVSVEEHMKNNVYANMKSVGYHTEWQTYGLERVIVTIAVWLCAIGGFVGIGLTISGRTKGLILFFACFAGFFLTAFLSSLRQQNKEQIKKNAIVYGGHVQYSRNPFTGEVVDKSNVDIHYVENNQYVPNGQYMTNNQYAPNNQYMANNQYAPNNQYMANNQSLPNDQYISNNQVQFNDQTNYFWKNNAKRNEEDSLIIFLDNLKFQIIKINLFNKVILCKTSFGSLDKFILVGF